MNDRDEPLYYAEDGKVWKRPVEKTIGNGQRAVTLGFPICTMHEACEGQEAGLAELLNRAEQVPLLLRALEEIRERMNAVANVAGNAGTQNTPAEGTSPAACRLDSGRTESATSEKMDVTAGETAPFSAREEQYRKALEETVGRIMNAEIDLSTGQTKATVAGRLRDIAADLRKALSTPEQASLPSEVKS